LKNPGAKPSKRKTALPKLIDKYYADLKDLAFQNVMYEMGVRPAFHALLFAAGKEHGWTLIGEHAKKVNSKTIRPDGTFKDQMNLVRGYWEAKDTADNLNVEIEKKRKAGYPLSNIIFEDSATAILYQNGNRLLTADMKDPARLSELVNQFFAYVEPEIEEFEQAVDQFKERVPDLAEGLKKKIDQAHKTNPQFKKAFADFFELCKTSLNPNIAQSAVDEMLIQHILTERLIREIFDNPEFVRRNVIAAEVEKVMLAMTSQSFDRNTYLKDLDRFYIAIERAARTMTDWSDKQYFLNTVYERFFQGYSVKLADTMGIVYTPQEIVDFMCASVAEVLEKEFGKKLWSDDVYIIDPCTGTGNFIVNLIRRIPKAKLEDVYKHRLFANEIMLLPYYIAALNIEHAYFEQAGRYESFEGMCFVDTLDLAEHAQGELGFMTAENSARVARQRKAPITVVIGNPPYNVGQSVHNEMNANRAYPVLDQRIRETYTAGSRATSVSKVSDAYVKFFRWATDRLNGRDGIVCYVSNNGFVDQLAFDGMRKDLMESFSTIYHLDLEGNVRHDPKLSGTTYNVFGIQVGVGITVAVRHRKGSSDLRYSRVDKLLRRHEKLAWVAAAGQVSKVKWKKLKADEKNTWLVPANGFEFNSFIRLASKEDRAARSGEVEVVFKDYSLGIATHRDAVVYDFNKPGLSARIEKFADDYNAEVDRYKRAFKGGRLDDFVRYDKIVWDDDLKKALVRSQYLQFDASSIRHATYRPFCRQWLYFDRLTNARLYGFASIFPSAASEGVNKVICCSDIAYRAQTFSAFVADGPVDLHLCATLDGHQCFPFYIYGDDGSNRRENITDWALSQFREHYKDNKIDKWAIFHYVYGLLHHPGYREKFADNLKRELPRIPFAPDFHAFATAGKELAKLHLDYEKLKPWDLEFVELPDLPLSYRVEDKMRLSKDKTRLLVNPSLVLTGIPPETFDYRLGNRSALDWVIDQYHVSTDKRSGITSDPNREDDEQYIVRLIGQVVRVSVETVKIINSLPKEFA
jgi:predicted helicase